MCLPTERSDPADPVDRGAEDAVLVARCRRGEAAAWAALVQRYQRLVYTIVLRGGLDEHAAADVFQTVFARLLQHLPRITEPQRLQAWIVTTAKREMLLQRRQARRTVSMTPADPDGDAAEAWDLPDDDPLPDEALQALQQAHQLRLGLAELDERCRTLLMLVFRDEEDALPYDEVARRMAMPVGSIGPTRARCLGKLRKRVTGD